MPEPSQTLERNATPRTFSKWGATRFVVTFLVLTLLLLSAGRYAVNTRAMNWYLFQVARQTSLVLGLLGGSSFVEDPSAYRNRAGIMRAELEAWRRGEEPKRAGEDAVQIPLTAFEVWEHRALKLDRDLRVERKYLALTDAPKEPPTATHQERIAYLRETLNRLKASTARGENGGTVAAPGVEQIIGNGERLVHLLELGEGPADVPIPEIEAQIGRGRELQRAFLDERVASLVTQIQDRLGPQVTFVANSSKEGPLRFTFSLVPDCGALPSMSIYLAALAAFPASLRKRLIGLAIGIPVLYLINIARLACLAVIGALWRSEPEVFEFAHQYVWQAVYVLIVVGVWLLWVELVVRPGTAWRTNPTSVA